MKFICVLFCTPHKCLFVDGDGILVQKSVSDKDYFDIYWDMYCYGREPLKGILSECGYASNCVKDAQRYLALSFDGNSIEKLKEELKRRAKRNKTIRERDKKNYKDWMNESEEVKKWLIGVDKNVDNFETGFSVYVLMNSGHTRAEQANFIRNRKQVFIQFVMKEMRKIKNGKYIDLIPFCKMSEITVKNNNEVVVTFEFKDGLKEAINGVN